MDLAAQTNSTNLNLKTTLTVVRKRDGRVVDFDVSKIITAATMALQGSEEGGKEEAIVIAKKVIKDLEELSETIENYTPSVEGIQDLVEKQLILGGYPKASKAYILYRKEHEELRENTEVIALEVKDKFEESKQYFRNPLAEFVYYVSYSKWRDELGRRETWAETIERFMGFMKENIQDKLSDAEYEELTQSVLKQDTIPSMRLMWSAGPAARATHVAAYNCSFIAPTKLDDFGEIMYISMCGCGVGFSVESHTVQALPQIKKQTGKMLKTHVVEDSKEGWASAFVLALKTWFNGKDIDFDFSQVRPAGARLATMGGRASGPAPLKELIDFSKAKILANQGKRLSNLDVHDIICKIGEIVIAGGVRRSALISLSDLHDQEMRNAKAGQFYINNVQRCMANNSAVYNNKPATAEFMDEWIALMKSGSGERGIFNRGGLETQLPKRRWKNFKKHNATSGTNPCGEINLRSKQFCNLSGIIVRAEDTEETLMEKVRIATILGTYQSTLTNFGYLSKDWKKNCEEERLLGVSITGYWDNELIRKPEVLAKLRDESIRVNKEYAKRFGVNPSTCITCVKPSGNSSQLLDTASGMHPRYSQYYIRRVRISANDPLFKVARDQGLPYNPEVGQTHDNATTYVIEFPVKAPEGAVVKDHVSAIDLLEHWKNLKVNFTEHNPSVTIYVGEHEWIEVANWVYANWEIVGGISFLPRSNHVYQLAPYEEIDEAKYNELADKIKHVDFSKILVYEKEDKTTGAKELACVSGACEI